MCRGSHMGTMAAMFVFQRELVWPQLTHRPSQLESQTFKSKSCDLMTQSPVRVTSRGSQAAAAAAKTETQKNRTANVCLYTCPSHWIFEIISEYPVWNAETAQMSLRIIYGYILSSPNLKWRSVTASSCFLTPCNDTFATNICAFHLRFG